MKPVRFFRVEYVDGPSIRPVYFRLDAGNRFWRAYPWGAEMTPVFPSLEEAVERHRCDLESARIRGGQEGSVTASAPVEVSEEEVRLHDPRLAVLIEMATAILKAEIGDPEATEPVDVEWEWIHDARGELAAVVRLIDWAGSVSATIPLHQLKDAGSLQNRLGWLWGDILEARTHRLFGEMRAAAQAGV